jgi:hypothetical protein
MRVNITHQRFMHPQPGKGATIVTDIEFPGYRNRVETKLPDGYYEHRDDESKAHAENVFKILDQLADSYTFLKRQMGYLP